MDTAVAVARPVNFEEAVRARVEAAILGSIPEEYLDTHIRKVWDQFFEPRKGAHYNSPMEPSHFEILVNSCIRERLKPMITDQIDKWGETTGWDPAVPAEEAVTRLAPAIVKSIMDELVSSVISRLQVS